MGDTMEVLVENCTRRDDGLNYPPTVVFDRSSILAVVRDERAGNGSCDGVGGNVSQAGANGQSLLFACSLRQGALCDFIARQHNRGRRSHIGGGTNK